MFKKLTIMLLLALTAGIIFFIKPKHHSINFADVSFSISFDGPIQPDSQAEILLYALNKKNLKALDNKVLSANLAARIEIKNKDGKFNPISHAEEIIKSDFPLILSFQIPENLKKKVICFNLYADSTSDKLLFSQFLTLKPDRTLILTPPSTNPVCGNQLRFKLNSLNLKTLKPEYRMPIRVKMQAPFKLFTINRVINTDINGEAIFETLLHKNAPPGLYNFFIHFANKEIYGSMPIIKDMTENKKTVHNNEKAKIDLSKNLTNYKIKFFRPKKVLFTSLKAEKDMLNFNFDCSGSSFRTIEIWQNGKLIDQSYLPIEKGRSTYPLPRKIDSKKPLKIKFWMLKNNKVEIDTRIVVINRDKAYKKLFNQLKNRVKGLSRFSENQFLTNFKHSQPFVYANVSGNKHLSPSIRSFYKIDGNTEQNKIPDYESIKSERIDYYKNSDTNFNFVSRFFIVKNEIKLAGYRFNYLLIHLNPVSFLNNFITGIPEQKTDILYLISEAEARLLLMNYLNLSEQKLQIKHLESLVTPLSEILLLLKKNRNLYTKISPRLFKVLKYLKNYTHVPDKLETNLEATKEKIPTLGPLKSILKQKLSKSELDQFLQSSGKVFIIKNKGSYQVNLTGDIIKQANQSEFNSENRIIKLANTRANPILIEISKAQNRMTK